MSWTDERVQLLKQLWQDGLSASTIARELGMSITRNAVIGKVHRMGLAGRAKSPNQLPTRPRDKDVQGFVPMMTRTSPIGMSGMPCMSGMPVVQGNNAMAIDFAPMLSAVPVVAPVPKPQPLMHVVIPETSRVTIMELRESMCKWPLGDPMNVDFRYCGAKAPLGGAPYCTTHAQIAYQPAQDRRRDRDRKQLRIG